MSISRICALYFSATGNTKKVTEAAAKGLSEALRCPVEAVDFTKPASREEERVFGADTLLVAGFPTYAGKLPNKILPDVKEKLCAAGADVNSGVVDNAEIGAGNVSGESSVKAVALVTFGNRSFDNSLAELTAVLSENGFDVIAGAAVPCRHAFSDLLAPGRPDEKDLQALENFGREAAEALQSGKTEKEAARPAGIQVPGDAAAPYYVPKGTDGQPAKFLKAKPLTDMEKCDHCGICVNLCPVGSISAEDVSEVPGICIKCQACVRSCPKGAKYFTDPAFLSHVAMLEQNFTDRKEAVFRYRT